MKSLRYLLNAFCRCLNAVKSLSSAAFGIYDILVSCQRQKGPSSRAHSAINDEAGSSIPRDRHHLLDVFSRPNTTHTYRVRCLTAYNRNKKRGYSSVFLGIKLCLAFISSLMSRILCQRVLPLALFSVRHSIPSLLHSTGQHRAGTAWQSLCGHRSGIHVLNS